MDHLTSAQIVDLIGGGDEPGAREHLDECPACRELEATWIGRMDSLRELEQERLDPAEVHRLRVMYRQLGPKRIEGSYRLASLVRSSDRQPAAVRGVAAGRVSEYEAGPYTLLVTVGPVGRRETVAVHGQLTASRGEAGSGMMTLSSANGRAYICDIDRYGEFHLREVIPGRYRALWWVDEGAVEVADLEIGTDEAS
jgi:hypothetical protein